MFCVMTRTHPWIERISDRFFEVSFDAAFRRMVQRYLKRTGMSPRAFGQALGDRRGELVSLILSVARREPVPGYVIVPAPESDTGSERGSVVEFWRGPRFTARVLRMPDGAPEDAEHLARLSGTPVVATWLSAPGNGPNGDRIAVLVEDNLAAEPVR